MAVRILVIILALMACPAGAEIYRSIGPDGSVTFSDRPGNGAKKVDLPPLPTYTPRAPVVSKPTIPEENPVNVYKKLRIVQPENDATLQDNTGLMEVELSLEPRLLVEAGHRVVITLDDTERSVESTRIRFSNIDRGTHSVRARVVDQDGKTLIKADPVTVHLRRQSRLQPSRTNR